MKTIFSMTTYHLRIMRPDTPIKLFEEENSKKFTSRNVSNYVSRFLLFRTIVILIKDYFTDDTRYKTYSYVLPERIT